MPVPDDFVALAVALADAARPVVMRYFRHGVAIDDKADATPVTIADREAEAVMRARVAAAFPDHGLIGEEHGSERPDAEWVWVFDPIDGTQGFVTGKPLFGTLIGLLHRGRPVLGVIDAPAMGERWIGAEGRPTTFNGRPARTRTCAGLGQAWMYTTHPGLFCGTDAEAFGGLSAAVKRTNFGGDCYLYGLLAAGFIDLVCETKLQLYDFVALVPVVEGAGGVITDWQGRRPDRATDGRILAAGDAAVHAAALDRLGGR